jgi:aldose 1-epimerase
MSGCRRASPPYAEEIQNIILKRHNSVNYPIHLQQESSMAVSKESFGKNRFGEAVDLFTLTNENGINVRIMNHGGVIVSLETPDKNGKTADIVLGHDTAAEYTQATPYFGAVIGRYANRIKGARFTLEGKEYTLAKNDGPNTLHGGLRGFDKVVWNPEIAADQNAIRLTYVSADGEEGFPGEVTATVTYTLTEANELEIDYTAESTQPTPCNITNHSYFNLAGQDAGTVGGQIMMINADTFLPADESSIPYGEETPVEGTPFDFRSPHAIGERIDDDHEQLRFAGGYDHNFCLNKNSENELSFAARAEDPVSGRILETYTTEPGVQFYSGNHLDGTLKGKGGGLCLRRSGFCLETQHYPDSPNQPQFPDTVLRPGSPFKSRTVYKFSVTE